MKGLRRGTRFGKYRLEKRLGRGASAEVWLGRDLIEGRKVAIKIILPSVVEEFGRKEVEHEARVAARLDHPNILAVRNADWAPPHFLIVTDVAQRSLEGNNFSRRSSATALGVFRDVAAGLAHAHGKRVLHRDIKPGNILLFPGGQAKIADFGTARLAPAGSRIQTEVGTLGYMAPEQAYGRPGYPSDVFSLGLTTYELLTGVLPSWPFEWPLEASDVFEKRTPKEVQPVLRKALQVAARRRWTNGVELYEALERALKRVEQREARPPPPRRSSRRAPVTPPEFEKRWFRRQYGQELALRFDCYRCGGPVSEAMKHCPWCGTDKNSFIDVTKFPLVCPDCERGVRPEWTACPWCYSGRFEGNGRVPPTDLHAERHCRKKGCEGEIRPFMRYCPLCKTKVVRPWSVDGLRPCKKCRWPIAPNWRCCPWCGRNEKKASAATKNEAKKR